MIVEAVGASVAGRENRARNQLKEAAMAQAVLDCLEVGITDPDVQKRFMLHYKTVVQAGGTVEHAQEALVKYAEHKD